MTTSRTIFIGAVLALGLPAARAVAADGWGASWSFGPTASTDHIIYAKTTLVPGRLPSLGTTGPLFLWPGMSNPTSDLIQTTMDAWGGTENDSYCGSDGTQWCVEASVFGSFGQRNGPSVAIDPDDQVTIEYTLGSDNNTWTQTVTSQKLGKVVSTLTSTSGLMLGGGFGFATEADANSFTIDTQYYLCTELHFATADPHFGATGVGANGAQDGATGKGSGAGTAKNVHTPDGGLTWLVDLITLPAMNPMGTQTPVPAYDCETSGTGGSGGAAGASGSGGTSPTSGSGGTGAVGGRAGSGGAGGRAGTGGSTAGGASGSGGHAGGTGGGASGGSSGTGGSATGETGGTAGNATGGASGTESGSGGNTGSGGRTAGTGGSGSGGSGKATGGTSSGEGGTTGGITGTGGSGTGGSGTSTSGSGGSAADAGSSGGCSCSIPQGRRGNGAPSLLLLASLVALRRRRRR